MYKKPKNDDKYMWTNHVVGKMGYYRISESLVKRVVRFPKRVEKGIVPETTACMQASGSKKNPSEVWVMYRPVAEVAHAFGNKSQKNKRDKSEGTGLNAKFNIGIGTSKKLIITSWRYPGVSPIGEPIPIPDDILAEIELAQD